MLLYSYWFTYVQLGRRTKTHHFEAVDTIIREIDAVKFMLITVKYEKIIKVPYCIEASTRIITFTHHSWHVNYLDYTNYASIVVPLQSLF